MATSISSVSIDIDTTIGFWIHDIPYVWVCPIGTTLDGWQTCSRTYIMNPINLPRKTDIKKECQNL